MELRNLRQPCAIELFVKLGEPASVCKAKIGLWGTFFIPSSNLRWHHSFLEDREHSADEHHPEMPSTSKNKEHSYEIKPLFYINKVKVTNKFE